MSHIFQPYDITLDVAEGKMYWVHGGKIQRANLDGSDIEDLATDLRNPRNTVRDVEGDKMYWTSWWFTDYYQRETAGKIQRANLDGSNIEDLVTDLSFPGGIALDVINGKMYWTDSGTDMIQRANLDGSNIENLVTDLEVPQGIALLLLE